jgi:hypothetical protein
MMDAIVIALAVGFALGTLAGALLTAMVQPEETRRRAVHDAEVDMLARNVRPAWMVEAERQQRATSTLPHLVNVRRVTMQNGVRVEENHVLPADVARRLAAFEGGSDE